MSNHGVRRLPILSGDRAVGLISYDDLLVAFGREFVKTGLSRDESLRSLEVQWSSDSGIIV